MNKQLVLLLCFLTVTIYCANQLDAIIEEDNLQTQWRHFRENAKQIIPVFYEYLPNVNVDDIINSINNDQFLIFYTGRISNGKTTGVTTNIKNGKDLLPSKFLENTCVFLYIKSDNSGENVRLIVQDGENEIVLESFPNESFSPLDAKKINERIEKENQKCMKMKSVDDVKKIFTTNLVLYVPKMRINNFSHKITIVDIGGYNIFEGSDISTEIKHQALQKFASNADAAILILKIDDLVGGDTIEIDLENIIKDRKDLATSKQLILVFNFLEKCMAAPSKFITENEQNSSDCTQYFARLARKRIDEIAQKHSEWALNIPDENIFILGLAYAEEGLYLKDSNLDDKGKIHESNVEDFFKRLEKMVKTESHNKIVSSTQRTFQLTSTSISVIDFELSDVEKNITRNQIGIKEISELKQYAHSNIANSISKLEAKIRAGISSTLVNLGTVINDDRHKNTLINYGNTIKAIARSALIDTQTELFDPMSEYDSKIKKMNLEIADSKPLQYSISKLKEISFERVAVPVLVPSEWSDQIRDSHYCGKHKLTRRPKKCHVRKSNYQESAKDSNQIFSIYEKEIKSVKKLFDEIIDKTFSEMLGSFNSQMANLDSEKNHLLIHKDQLEKLKGESNDLFKSANEYL